MSTAVGLDIFVGKKLKERRDKLLLSQGDLAEMVGISYQQVQKYEKGENKIPAGRLYQLAKALKVTPDYFFEGAIFDDINREKSKYLHLERDVPLNILVVEDNPVDEMLTRDAIAASGLDYDLFVVHDGDQAVQYLKNIDIDQNHKRPDIILLDLNIPKRNGLEVLKEIRRDRNSQDIPVIVLTNSINPTDMDVSYRHHACGYVSKSFNIEEYNKKIATIIYYWSNVAILPSMQLI